jgi:hypothetical protein
MNEQFFASRIRLALDESADHLPYRVTQRLERARQGALGRARPVAETVPGALAVGQTAAVGSTGPAPDRPSGLHRLLGTVIPVLVLVAGLYGIYAWDDAQRTAEAADIDAEIVLADDEVPLSAYADKGFGAYLRNVRE